MSIQSIIVSNSEVRVAVYFEWIQFLYDLTHSIFLFTHIHTSFLISIIFIFYFITLLLQLLLWSQNLHCWKISIVIEAIQVIPCKPILSFRILHVNTKMNDYTIYNYCYRYQCFTVCALQTISFIVLLIQLIIIGKRYVRAVVSFKLMQFLYD